MEQLKEVERVAVRAEQRALDNSDKLVLLAHITCGMVARQQLALSTVPTFPPASGRPVAQRTMRSYAHELLAWVAKTRGIPHDVVRGKAYREYKARYGFDAEQRAKNLKKLKGHSKASGLSVLEAEGRIDQFYDLCVEMFGLPTNPLPSTGYVDDIDE
jgi:hypothetical protein